MAAPEQVIQMASLGRPFRLGMVYDCRSDTLIPGITLWDPKELKKNLDVQPQPYFTSQIIATDSTSEKASLLNASASLKGSFLAGLVEVEGSAKFLQDTKKSARQARVTFSYAATTHFQQLTMSQVGKQHITYPEVFGQGLATHVVTGILYGAHAFFVFDQEASSSESLQDIEGNLQVLVKKIPKFSLEGKAEAQMSETEKAAIQKFSCTFYGDFKLKKNPTNYMEAVELYARLPELMGEDGENAVPVKVWLYPLSYLDSTAAKLVREISSKLISDSEKALEHLTEVDMRTNDLARDPICTAFPEIKGKIHHFKGLCQQYRHEFQKDVGRLLPAIRGGGQEEEGALVNHLKKNEASLFNASRLQAFLDLKCQEIRFVEFFLKLSKGEVSSCDEFMKKVLDPSVDSVFALVFSSLEAKEPYLEELDFGLQEAAGHAPKASPEKGNISTPWFQDKAVLERAQNAATIFADLSLRPQTKEKVQFVVTSSLDESNPGVSIVRYQSGSLEGTRFEILPKPLPPLVDEKTHCSVQLTFKPAEPERSRVSGYHVQYRVSGQENWVSVHVKEDIYPIRGLKAKTSYEFRYAVETSSGCSVASDISQAMLNAFPSSPPPPSPSSSFWGKNVGCDSDFLGEEMAESTSAETEKRLASKFLNISIPIVHGEPSVFALPLKKEADPSSLHKCHLGEENLEVPNKAIMVMGATGSGKTTLINAMVNCILGVRWEDRFRFKLIHEETERSQAESQTSEVTAYVLNHQQGFQIPYSLTIVDTPGFGDARGMECDKLITKKIRKLFASPGGIDHIDSVCFVVKAPSGHLTPAQKYVFEAVLSIFGKDIKDNIQILVTFADGQNPPVLEAIKEVDVPCAKDARGAPVYFKFNNSALFASNAAECAGSFNFDEMFWKMGEMSMKTFFDSVNNLETRSLTLTKEVLRERKELETVLAGLKEQLKIVRVKVEELRKTQEVLDLHKKDVEANKDFAYKVEVVEPVEEDTGYNAINCRTCNFTCYYPGWKTWNFLDRFCTAINLFSGNCEVCPGHCPLDGHFQEKCRFLNQVVTKTKTFEGLKEECKDALLPGLLFEYLRAEEKKETETLAGLTEKVHKSRQRLRETKLKPTLLESIDLLIQKEEQEAKVGFQERVQKLKSVRKDPRLMQRLSFTNIVLPKGVHLPQKTDQEN